MLWPGPWWSTFATLPTTPRCSAAARISTVHSVTSCWALRRQIPQYYNRQADRPSPSQNPSSSPIRLFDGIPKEQAQVRLKVGKRGRQKEEKDKPHISFSLDNTQHCTDRNAYSQEGNKKRHKGGNGGDVSGHLYDMYTTTYYYYIQIALSLTPHIYTTYIYYY